MATHFALPPPRRLTRILGSALSGCGRTREAATCSTPPLDWSSPWANLPVALHRLYIGSDEDASLGAPAAAASRRQARTNRMSQDRTPTMASPLHNPKLGRGRRIGDDEDFEMPNLLLLGNWLLILFGMTMVLSDVHATMLSGVWRPESLGDWLDGAHIQLLQHNAALFYDIPASAAFLAAATLIWLLAPTSRG